MNVDVWPIGEVSPYPGNPRVNDQAITAVRKSIEQFGWRQPIVVDGDGVIVVGHTRWKAAKAMGLEKVPVHVAMDLTPEQCRAFRLADNKTAEASEWNTDLLNEELRALAERFDMMDFGFSEDDLHDALADAPLERDADAIPDPCTDTLTRPGDLWLLGRHRLLCCSSLEAAVATRATGNAIPLAITDPPFELAATEQAQALRLADVQTGIVFGGGREIFALANISDYRLRFDFVIVYDRSIFLTGRSSLIYRHNRILLMDRDEATEGAPDGCSSGVIVGKGVAFNRDRWATITGTKCSVLQAPIQRTIYGYGKACDLFRCFVRAMDSDSVYDPFAGSGTGMIACEIEGKAWTGIELRPEVCDIAVKRWEDFTKEKAILERGT